VPDNTRALLHAGAAILGIAVLVMAAMWPLGFWLPRTYAAAPPAVAALFAVMTMGGVYVLLRLSLLLFGAGAGAASAHFGAGWLLWGGVATVAVGVVGMLGARELGKLAGYNVLVSSGSLLGAVGLQQPAVTAGALAYLVVSTLAIAAFFLLAGLIAPREDAEGASLLEPYDPTGMALYADEDESQAGLPAPVALLAGCFLLCALVLAGLPPLSGFLAKFALLAPMLGGGAGAVTLFALVVAAGLCTVIAMCRTGIQIFWADEDWMFPAIRAGEAASVVILLALCLGLTVLAEAPLRYLVDTAAQLHAPQHYIRAVLP
jgi:multicomponent K+:H+ antiporter subunit D